MKDFKDNLDSLKFTKHKKMTIYELDPNFFVNLGKTEPYKVTEIVGKDHPDNF